MKRRGKIWTMAAIAALSLSLMACDDDDASSTIEYEDPDDPTTWDEPEDPTKDDPIVIPEEPEDGWEVLLVPAMATDIEIAQKAQTKLRVSLVSIVNDDTIGTGVQDKQINWIVAEDSKDYVVLKTAVSFTNEQGIAEVTLGAKDLEGSALVTATYKDAPKSVKFNVNVAPLPTGSMRAYASYSGYANPQNYSLRLYDSADVACDLFDPKYPPTETPLLKEDASSVVFDHLATDAKYTLVALGYGANGAVVAAGCTQAGTTVYANQTTEAFVSMSTVDLDPVSTYHVRSYFDFGDIVKGLGSVGKMVTMITDFVDAPGDQLYGYLMDAVKVGLSQILPSAVASFAEKAISFILDKTGVEDKLTDYIENLVLETKTGCQIGLFGCQLRNIVRTMELTGDLSIEKQGSLQLSGQNSYDGMSVYWRIGCENSTDPNCGRLHYSFKSLNLGTKVNALEGSWQGSLSNGYDRITIESHNLSMYYGKIVTYIIEKVLLPKIANGADDFQSAIEYWINCESIANKLSDWLTITHDEFPAWLKAITPKDWGINVSHDKAYGWCSTAAKTLGGALNFFASMEQLQSLNSNVTISGSALMHDVSADNVIDDIDNGAWSGNMTLTVKNQDGTSTPVSTAVNGVWSAYNAKNVQTGFCSYPKSASDSDDQICSYPSIDTSSLITTNLCNQYPECAK